MKKNAFRLRPIVIGMLLLGSGIASAANITLVGTDASFTFDDTLMGLFGTPTLTGNTIFFTPNDFNAISTNGSGTVLSSSSMNMIITPNQGTTLSSIGLQERGVYSLSGSGSSVGVGGQIRAFSMVNPIAVQDSMPILTSTDLTVNDNSINNWVATAGMNLDSAMWQGAGAINFSIQNILKATTVNNVSAALVDKNFAGFSITASSGEVVPPSAVPVPAAAWLFGSGLVGLVGVSRRRLRV